MGISHEISNSAQAVPAMVQSTSDYTVTIDKITTDTFERKDMRYITSYNASILGIIIQNTCDKPITIVPDIGHINYYDEEGKTDYTMNGYCLVQGYGTLTKRINANEINEIRMLGFRTQTIDPKSSFRYELPFHEIDFSKNPMFTTTYQETWDDHGTLHGKEDKIGIKLLMVSLYPIDVLKYLNVSSSFKVHFD